jgi:hypothetical protein
MAKSRAGGCLMQKESHTVAKITSDGFQFLVRPARWQVGRTTPPSDHAHSASSRASSRHSALETCVPKTARLMEKGRGVKQEMLSCC